MPMRFEFAEEPPPPGTVFSLRQLGEHALDTARGSWYLFYSFFGFSSLHGFAHITRRGRNPAERLFWAITCALAFWGALTLGLQTWQRFQTNPTVVSMERNYKDWNTSFPSVALCPSAQYTEETLKKTIEEYEYVKDKSKMRRLLKGLAVATYGTFDKIDVDFNQLPPSEYAQAIGKMIFPFQYKVSNSNPENYNIFTLFPFMSEIGICYSYNSDATYYNDPRYWEQDRWTSLGQFPVFHSNPLDGDIFAQMRGMNAGYQLYILDPSEFPDIAMFRMSADNNTYKTLDLTALSIVSTPASRGLSVNQRRCRLQHESNLDISPIYSYNLCRQECRRDMSFRLCTCVPFFYRATRKYPVCNVKGMQCLQQYSELLTKLVDPDTGKKVQCACYPLCDEVNYLVDADNTMTWTLGTNLKIGLIKYPKFRLKRDIIFGSSDLLVSIGGTAGLFLGCSILSLAEAVYYFIIRPVYYFKYNMPLPFA